jgi:hypothetical protein
MSLARLIAAALLFDLCLNGRSPQPREKQGCVAVSQVSQDCNGYQPRTEQNCQVPESLGLFSVPEFKSFSHETAPIQDIERRLPQVHQYWNECPVTWVHEGTHYINSRITRDSKASQGLYLLDGVAVTLDCPSLTLAQIAAYIPEEDRRTIYQTYLVQQRQWWNDSPLYLLNEWVAYGNGTVCRMSLNWTGQKRIDTVRFFLEMEVYVHHLVRLAAKDPDYKGLTKLETFVEWYGRKIRDVVGPEDISLAELELRTK